MLGSMLVAACSGTAPVTAPPEAAAVRALHAEGPSGNVAVATLDLPLPPGEALVQAVAAATTLPRWRHAGTRGQVAWLTRRTRVFRFTDDVLLLAEPRGTGTRLLMRSASRVGRSDLGQNARNLEEFETRLLAVLASLAR